jgi:TPR repeat protein
MMTPGTESLTPPKTGLCRQGLLAAQTLFFTGSPDFFYRAKKNKKYPQQKFSGRITPLPPCGVIAAGVLAAVIFFSPAGAEEAFRPTEQILCPDIDSANAGSMLDEYYLGRAYDKGYCGIIADKKSALQWYLKAAKDGHMLAQYQLGEIYYTGNGGTPDYPQARRWYLEAAKQGHGPSELRLGFLYAEGHYDGLKTDYVEAEKWFKAAAIQNTGDARFRLGNFYHNYKNPPDMKQALFWLTRAAEGGNRVAMFDLARLIKDPEQSLAWIKKAADLDLLSAQETLSRMYATGDGVPKDPVQSMIWTLKIAGQPTAAVFWINKAADIFFDGWETIPKSYPQAIKLYERAAVKDDPHALARLGQIYMEGLGITADPEKARAYLDRAVALGSTEAKQLLEKPKEP